MGFMVYNTYGDSNMIVQHQWIFENLEKDPKTIASKMILFRGEKVFRVGFKNLVKSPFLFFMAIDLNKLGLKVKGVTFGIQDNSDIDPASMWEMGKEDIGDEGSLQLYKTTFTKQLIGKETFLFRIHIQGSVPDYSYRLSDRLAKNQFWAAAKNKNSVDVEFLVKGKTFPAHKVILAARSSVFTAEFTSEPKVEDAPGQQIEPSSKRRKRNNVLHQIRVEDVEPATVEQFLHFIYTGEPMRLLINEELLKLAVKYQLKTLISLCKVALQKISSAQMVKLTSCLQNLESPSSSSTVKPDKEAVIFFDRTPTFQCSLKFKESEQGKSKKMMRYQNEDIFSVYFTGEKVTDPTDKKITNTKHVIHLLCSEHRKFGLEIADVCCKHYTNSSTFKCYKMESKHSEKNAKLLLHFTAQLELNISSEYSEEICFDVKVVTTIDNYYYEMMDGAWMNNFWYAATKEKLTDVEIFVGTVKVMEAHRIILSAQSPAMKVALNKISYTGKFTFTFDAEYDVDIVKYFLKFLYNGFLESSAKKSADYKQLLKLATKYKVETLKNMCQLANNVPDVEQFTNSLLDL